MFIIKRIPDGLMVAKQGQHSSYTNDILKARTFRTKEEAQNELCIENERIVDIGYNSNIWYRDHIILE